MLPAIFECFPPFLNSAIDLHGAYEDSNQLISTFPTMLALHATKLDGHKQVFKIVIENETGIPVSSPKTPLKTHYGYDHSNSFIVCSQ